MTEEVILARAPGRLGEYLGTTATRMGPGDAILAGFADYYLPEETWPDLYRALARARDGDGLELAVLAELHPVETAYFASNRATVCLDGVSDPKPDPAEILAAAQRLGPWMVDAFELCDVWPIAPRSLPPISYGGPQPILVVGMTGDWRTPLESCRDLTERLEGSTLLIVERTAHNAYEPKYRGMAVYDTRCVTNTVDRYLIDLEAPDDGSVCRHGTPGLLPPG